MDITSLTAVELGKKIKAKEISVVEAVKAFIAQIEKVKAYWEGQESDGWGEGFEQRGIKIPEGELYVSFWNSGDEFFLTTEEGLKGEEQEPAVQKGGIVFGAL